MSAGHSGQNTKSARQPVSEAGSDGQSDSGDSTSNSGRFSLSKYDDTSSDEGPRGDFLPIGGMTPAGQRVGQGGVQSVGQGGDQDVDDNEPVFMDIWIFYPDVKKSNDELRQELHKVVSVPTPGAVNIALMDFRVDHYQNGAWQVLFSRYHKDKSPVKGADGSDLHFQMARQALEKLQKSGYTVSIRKSEIVRKASEAKSKRKDGRTGSPSAVPVPVTRMAQVSRLSSGEEKNDGE